MADSGHSLMEHEKSMEEKTTTQTVSMCSEKIKRENDEPEAAHTRYTRNIKLKGDPNSYTSRAKVPIRTPIIANQRFANA
jgi:hypothetical protein